MPPSYIRVRAVVWAYGRGQTDRQTDIQTRVTTIHFASSTTHAKCNNYPRSSWPSFIIITSGQSNLTKGRIAAANGRLSPIRQVALVCMLPWSVPQTASRSVQPFLQGSRSLQTGYTPRYSVCSNRPHLVK